MSRLVLYMSPPSPASRSVMMLAEMLGLQLSIRPVNLLKMQQKTPEFRKINPLEQVPVLMDGDFILTDSHAILKYLVTAYGGDKQESLYPSEARARAVVDQRMFFNASFFSRKVLDDVTLSEFLHKGPSAHHIDNIEHTYSILETYLCSSPFMCGDRLTLADVSVGVTAAHAQVTHRIDDDRHPNGASWLSRLQKEPAFQKIVMPGVELLSMILKKYSKRNNA